MTRFLEFFITVALPQILWPLKGIIYMEEQALQWIVAYAHAWIWENGSIILLFFAIIFVLSFVLGSGRRPRRKDTVVGIFHLLWSFIVNVCFAWFFLIYGAIAGALEEDQNPQCGVDNARVIENIRINHTRCWTTEHRYTRLSVHFRIGRGLFRIFYKVMEYLPILGDDRLKTVRKGIARLLALVIILWGVWNIPYDLMH